MDMQDPIDATMFSQGAFDAYRFSNGLPQDNLVSTPGGMPIVGSVDSGLGNDGMDFLNQGENAYQHERRSSSEEKESLTPAQSRRKAQNRAAYVYPVLEECPHSRFISHNTNQSYLHTDKELSAKEKKDTSKTSKLNSPLSNPQPLPLHQTINASNSHCKEQRPKMKSSEHHLDRVLPLRQLSITLPLTISTHRTLY
jgi:hypothetical protein